jgi:outer membrane protein OmpA-like peptidoglycan-associated protein
MVKRESPSGRGAAASRMGRLALLGLLIGAAGCSPVATYRHWTGIAANDPNPETTPNTKNLAAGDAASYPNLATVPPPPSQALTTAELNKLTQGLIADRTTAKYTSEHLQAQFNEAAAPPPPPPAPPPPAPPPPAGSAAGGKPAVTPAAPAVGPAAPNAAPAPTAPSAATPSATGATASAAGGTTPKGPRKSGQPPQPGPMESSLQSPQIASLPQAEQYQPGPPVPGQLSTPAAPPANATAPGAHLPAPPAPAPMPAAIGSAKFQPAPPVPYLPPPAPIRTATATQSGKPPKPPPPTVAYTQVADIDFAGEATTLSDADREAVAKLVPRYREKSGMVRVVGYAGVGSSASQQLASYRTALDRAQAVAAALSKAGIPASKIQVEAAPTGGDSGQGRAEILFAQ